MCAVHIYTHRLWTWIWVCYKKSFKQARRITSEGDTFVSESAQNCMKCQHHFQFEDEKQYPC